jgi:predicted ester cyclase
MTQTMLSAMARYSVGDLDGYLELYDDSIVLHGYGPEPFVGKEQVREFYAGIMAAFSDPELVGDEVFAVGDRGVIRFTLTMTHTGEFWGAPASGNRVSASGITILRFANGRCVERWSSFDFLSLLAQIGAVPAPA